MSDTDPRSSKSIGDSPGLRDARLAKALEHAPDAHMHPDAAIRASILNAAGAAVKPVPSQKPKSGGWWSWWRGEGEQRSRMPWNAALASVLVAGFVTLMWQGEPVPEARLDSEPVPQAEAPAVASPEPEAKESVQNQPAPDKPAIGEAASAAPSPEAKIRAPATGPAMKKPAPPTPVLTPSPPSAAPAPAPAPAPDAAAPAKTLERSPAQSDDSAATAEGARSAQSMRNAQREASSVAAERRFESERARGTASAGASAGETPPAMAPAPAAAPRMAPRAPVASQTADVLASPKWPPDWTHLRRLPEGAALPRSQAARLAQLMSALPQGEAASAPITGEAMTASVQLLTNDRVLGVLELYSSHWRFKPAAPDLTEFSGALRPSILGRFLEELNGLSPVK
ncbi:hypothetical protein [Ottowia thiooxydans]|uniref:Uncharacterized protein n=1 Tax=Ottowia thiooxydans TaxID=219182 RepID=A0ABV2QDL8_9BURK